MGGWGLGSILVLGVVFGAIRASMYWRQQRRLDRQPARSSSQQAAVDRQSRGSLDAELDRGRVRRDPPGGPRS